MERERQRYMSWHGRKHQHNGEDCFCPLMRDHTVKPPIHDILPPNWEGGTSGGWQPPIEEIPTPHIRMFPRPDGRPRHVTMTIISWRGFAPGASHFYLTFQIEHNPIWDGRPDSYNPRGRWRAYPDEFEKNFDNIKHRGRFTRKDHIERWIKAVLSRFEGWDVTIVDNTEDIDDRNFVYHRQGD